MMDESRRKRIKRLKRVIVTCFLLAVCVPTTLCILQSARLHMAQEEIARLQEQLAAATGTDTREAAEAALEVTPALPDEIPDAASFDPESEEANIRRWEESDNTGERKVLTASGMREVYLTFDDGPSIYTDRILDILKEYGVKATFFVVAKGKEDYEDSLRRIVAEGHTLGMHSYSHKYREIYASKEAFIKDVNALQDYLHDVTGVYPQVYRFPGGSSNRASGVSMKDLEAYLSEIGVRYYDWNVSCRDATGRGLGKDSVTYYATHELADYSEAIILMHDAADKKSTVDALPGIIEKILAMPDTVILPITEETVPIQHDAN